MAPKSTAGKIAAATYVVACLAVLAFAISAREFRDAEILVAYVMLLLSFPIGYVVAALYVAVGYVLEKLLGTSLPEGLANTVGAIFAFGAAGYSQWFILVPSLYRRVKVPSNNALEADREA